MDSRRDFLKLGGLAFIGSLALGTGNIVFGQTEKNKLFPIPSAVYADNAFYFTHLNFEPLVNTNFEMTKKSQSIVTLRLVEVVNDQLKGNLEQGFAGESFMLIFERNGGKALPDKIYDIYHPNLGNFQLFISTVGRSGIRYQAVVNRVNL